MMSQRREEGKLAFEAMDGFMSHVIGALQRYGALAIRVFPPDSGVLLAFSDKLASEVVSTGSSKSIS
jgi:recyclin-1